MFSGEVGGFLRGYIGGVWESLGWESSVGNWDRLEGEGTTGRGEGEGVVVNNSERAEVSATGRTPDSTPPQYKVYCPQVAVGGGWLRVGGVGWTYWKEVSWLRGSLRGWQGSHRN
jgi:hypothetical protein